MCYKAFLTESYSTWKFENENVCHSEISSFHMASHVELLIKHASLMKTERWKKVFQVKNEMEI